jgi:hypothetical protein
MASLTKTTTISTASDGLSAAIDLSNSSIPNGQFTLAGIIMPAAWTTASLTFLVSADGSAFYPLYNLDGSEYEVLSPDVSRCINVPPQDFMGYRSIKLRSGKDGAAVQQGGSRAFTVILALTN